MVTGGGGKPGRRTGPGVEETTPGGMLPAGAPGDAGRVPEGSGRVRRPADLLFAVLSMAVVAVVLANIRALPLGSTELADYVSPWLAVVRGPGGVRGRVFHPGGRRRGGDGPRPVAGRAHRGGRRVHRRRGGYRRVGCLAGRERR